MCRARRAEGLNVTQKEPNEGGEEEEKEELWEAADTLSSITIKYPETPNLQVMQLYGCLLDSGHL